MRRFDDLRADEDFSRAANFGSLTHGAERLGLTESAVSVSIKKLEEKHDVGLFDCLGRRLVLTEAGESCSTRQSESCAMSISRSDALKAAASRPVFAGCLHCKRRRFLDAGLSGARRRCASRGIDPMRGTVDEATAWVMRGTADVGVTMRCQPPQFRQVGVFADRMTPAGIGSARGKSPPTSMG